MAKKIAKKKRAPVSTRRNTTAIFRGNMGLAMVALVLNIFVPGLGSLVAGKTKEGIWQLVLVAVVLIATLLSGLLIVGFLLIIIPLLWGIVTGIRLIKEAQ